MTFSVVNEVWPFYFGALIFFMLLGMIARLLNFKKTTAACYFLALIGAGFMLFFFRNPERTPPADPAAVVAGADGTVMAVKEMREDNFLKSDAVRISIFLSLFDVHVNRAPIGGKITFLQYYPGKKYFTFMEKSSACNQHSSIVIENAHTRCLVNQIVGPMARRVVYWLELGQMVVTGERIGMMKFGSRLDMYFPKADIEVIVKPGARVKAGVTVVAKLKSNPPWPSACTDLPPPTGAGFAKAGASAGRSATPPRGGNLTSSGAEFMIPSLEGYAKRGWVKGGNK